MKKLIVYSFLIYLFLGFLLPFININAQDLPEFDIENPQAGIISDNPRATIVNIFQIVFRVLIWLALGFAVIFFAWAGVLIIVQGKIDAGKDKLIYGVVGLVIALISWAVVNLLASFVQSGQLGQ